MSNGLATRCSACGTVFRVVADQLRVSEGWVRCGRCSEVFNALESLVDLDTGMPRRDSHLGLGAAGDGSGSMPLEVAQPAARPGAPPLPPPPPPKPVDAAAQLAREFASTSAPETRPPLASELSTSVAAADPAALPVSRPGDFAAEPAPSFVRQADRAARWRRPGVRLALASVALLLAATLAAQVAHTWRDHLAARVPALEPVLAQGCAWLGCKLGPARALNALSVESSGLVRVERSNLYKLQVSLRNRAEHPVALPALDVTLTDARGELVARRVLRLSELGETAATIPPGRDLALQGTLQAGAASGEARVIAGYTVELFYP